MRLACMALLLFALVASSAARADEYLDKGFRLYFKYHPPAGERPPHDFYPNPGPVIHAGDDIPVCAEAATDAAYAQEKRRGMRYLLHGRDGWLFATNNFRTDFTASPQEMEYFTRLNAALESKGQKLVVFFGPPRAMLESAHFDPAAVPQGYTTEKARAGYEAFQAQLAGAGITAAGVADTPSGADYFHAADVHWTKEGAEVAAKAVASVIKGLPAYGDIPRQDYETEETGFAAPAHGLYEDAMQRVCKVNIELQSDRLWATVPVSSGDLLGDAAFPGITALGTSFSAADDRYVFVGALKRLLHADIYNAALTAGGFGGSAYRYFASDEYHEHPPKIVLWEFLAQHNYNSPESRDAFRQMIPAVYGPCAEKDALAAYSGAAASSKITFFEKGKQPLKHAYLTFSLTDPAERELRLQILYADGNADDVKLTRSTLLPNNGRYYLDLSSAAPALYFRLVTNAPRGRLDARLCRYPGGE